MHDCSKPRIARKNRHTWRVNQDGRTIDVLDLVSDERLGSVAHAVLPDLKGVEAAVDKGFRIW